jgi:hypothetical protein
MKNERAEACLLHPGENQIFLRLGPVLSAVHDLTHGHGHRVLIRLGTASPKWVLAMPPDGV